MCTHTFEPTYRPLAGESETTLSKGGGRGASRGTQAEDAKVVVENVNFPRTLLESNAYIQFVSWRI